MIYSFHLGRFFSYHSPYTLTYIVLSLSNLRFLCKSHTVLNSLLHIISFCDLVSSTLTGYVMVFSRPKKIIYKIDFSFFSLIFFLLKFITLCHNLFYHCPHITNNHNILNSWYSLHYLIHFFISIKTFLDSHL